MKYIDADLLREKIVREVEQWKEKTANHYTIEAEARWSEANYILNIFTSLQQEQPEVDLEKAAQHVYESWMGGTMDDVRRDMIELGRVLNARKED